MSKQLGLIGSVTAVVCFASVAFAQDDAKKKEAQAKVDASKVEVCEKAKKFLDTRKAKGQCTAEHDEASKITCSATTSKQVTDLMTKCSTAKPVAADKSAAPAAVPKCRALDLVDPTKVIAEAEDKLVTKCVRLLTDKLKANWCSAENKGKKFEYTTDYDHMVGKTKMKAKKTAYTCRVVNK